MKLKNLIIKTYFIFKTQLGIDPLLFLRTIRGIPFYISNFITFRKNYKGNLVLTPCLNDKFDEGGSTKNEYFWQDLHVARRINFASPNKHVDVGSRIDGFVAHVASFRDLEVFDVRTITSNIPRVIFKQINVMDTSGINLMINNEGYCDSLSCLHTIEHFGLGRYGDPIDPLGYIKGLSNLASLLKPDGRLYLSTPMGRERVEFNANWVFSPYTIFKIMDDLHLKIERIDLIDPKYGVCEYPINELDSLMKKISLENYNLVIMEFKKSCK